MQSSAGREAEAIRPRPAGLHPSCRTAGLYTVRTCELQPAEAKQTLSDSMRNVEESRRTGTAAIRVGCRTLVSPLLPFLIFVDFWGEEKQNQKRAC